MRDLKSYNIIVNNINYTYVYLYVFSIMIRILFSRTNLNCRQRDELLLDPIGVVRVKEIKLHKTIKTGTKKPIKLVNMVLNPY